MRKNIRAILVGNPNCGKTTILNSITNSNFKTGNWSGVTVDRFYGDVKYNDYDINICDTPGLYSVFKESKDDDKAIARDCIIQGEYDVIINVVDYKNIERSLFLTHSLSEIGKPIVIAINFEDEIKKNNIEINLKYLREYFNCQVCIIQGNVKKSVNKILECIVSSLNSKPNTPDISLYKDVMKDIDNAISEKSLSSRLEAIKMINADSKYRHISYKISDIYYRLSNALYSKIIIKQEKKVTLTEKVDKIILNKFLAIPIFMGTMYLFFKIVYNISGPFIGAFEGICAPLKKWSEFILNSVGTPDIITDLIVNGALGGLEMVFAFLPVVAIMMFMTTLMESSGYMARISFITDRFMRSIGMHGGSFVSFIVSLGCNVPAVYATRTSGDITVRKITVLLLPFMSCSARLPVYVLFGSVFFTEYVPELVFAIYMFGVVVACVFGYVLKKIYKSEESQFVIELPPYRIPMLRILLRQSYSKLYFFIKKAGTYIVTVMLFVHILLEYPKGREGTEFEGSEFSYLGTVSSYVAPVFAPLGFGTWDSTASLFTGIIAKEIVITTLKKIYDMEEEEREEEVDYSLNGLLNDILEVLNGFVNSSKEVIDGLLFYIGIEFFNLEDENGNDLATLVGSKFTKASAVSFLVFVLLYMPCVVTAIAIKNEFGSWNIFYLSMLISFVTAWILSYISYQIALLIIYISL